MLSGIDSVSVGKAVGVVEIIVARVVKMMVKRRTLPRRPYPKLSSRECIIRELFCRLRHV
eukprot:5838351-Ditylum_brightwellii.AAC.1